MFVHPRADFARLCRRIWDLLYDCLARLVAFSRQRIPLLAVIGIILIVIADAFTTRIRVSQPVDAVFDEPAHIATGLLLLGFLPASFRARYGLDGLLGVLLGSVLIDIDHLPQEFGHEFLTRGTDRPYPHSLLTLFIVLIVVALLRGTWRRIGCGFAFGLAAHFLRDLATNRVPLGWPLTNYGFHLPYFLYTGVMLLALAMVLWRDGRKIALYDRCQRPILPERPNPDLRANRTFCPTRRKPLPQPLPEAERGAGRKPG